MAVHALSPCHTGSVSAPSMVMSPVRRTARMGGRVKAPEARAPAAAKAPEAGAGGPMKAPAAGAGGAGAGGAASAGAEPRARQAAAR